MGEISLCALADPEHDKVDDAALSHIMSCFGESNGKLWEFSRCYSGHHFDTKMHI